MPPTSQALFLNGLKIKGGQLIYLSKYEGRTTDSFPTKSFKTLTNGTKKHKKCISTCSFILSWKLDGNMLGNSFRNTGSKNSMNGTMMKTAKGTSLNMSAVVLVSCCLSLLERPFPLASFTNNLELILTSAQSSFAPNQ